jgi:hypothetical protein
MAAQEQRAALTRGNTGPPLPPPSGAAGDPDDSRARAHRVPDRRLVLAPISTTRRHPARITAALSGAATAMVAMAPRAQAAVPAGAASPGQAHPVTVSVTGTVEGTAQNLTPANKHHHHPVKPRRHHHLRPRQIGWRLLKYMHWNPKRQFPALNALWNRESGWNVHAYNPYTGATGIPQATPGFKMASAGPNWQTSAWTQERWGLHYIRARYGSPRAAWAHSLATGWY